MVGLLTVSASATFAAIECGEGRVPDYETKLCIEPDYIEGC